MHDSIERGDVGCEGWFHSGELYAGYSSLFPDLLQKAQKGRREQFGSSARVALLTVKGASKYGCFPKRDSVWRKLTIAPDLASSYSGLARHSLSCTLRKQ